VLGQPDDPATGTGATSGDSTATQSGMIRHARLHAARTGRAPEISIVAPTCSRWAILFEILAGVPDAQRRTSRRCSPTTTRGRRSARRTAASRPKLDAVWRRRDRAAARGSP
jgi:hypothetical protein